MSRGADFDSSLVDEVREYLIRPATCFVPEDDFFGEALAEELGYVATSSRDAPNALGYALEQIEPQPVDSIAVSLWIRLIETDELADYQAAGYDACIKAAVHCLSIPGKPLPLPLAKFVSEVLMQTRTRPKRRGQPRIAYAARDASVIGAVALGVRGGLNAHRSDASVSISACDLVAECLHAIVKSGQAAQLDPKMRRVTSYKRLREIWANRKKHGYGQMAELMSI